MFARNPAAQTLDIPLSKEFMVARHGPLPGRGSTEKVIAERVPLLAGGTNIDGVVIIGNGSRISGDVTKCSRLEIHGAVEGRISADTLIVREGGSVKGEIYAGDAEIDGNIEGLVDVKGLLVVRTTGRVEGEVAYGKLSVAMGAQMAGQFRRTAEVGIVEPNDPDVVPISSHGSFVAAGFERQE